MKRALQLFAITACLVSASTMRSGAAITLANWVGNPQTVGGTTWQLIGTDLPDTLLADFNAFGQLRIDGVGGQILGGQNYFLNYTISLGAGNAFASVSVDSAHLTGSTTVTKSIKNPQTLAELVSASAVNGTPSGWAAIPGFLSTVRVEEQLLLKNGAISGFGNAYQISAVPEPGTILAGALLLLPFGASTLRVIRKRH